MIFVKSIIDFPKLSKVFGIISMLIVTLVLLINIKFLLDEKIYEENNQEEYRTIEMISSDSETLLKKYDADIESYSLDGEAYIVIFKSIEAKDNFIETEDNFDHFDELINYTGRASEFLETSIIIINVMVVLIYIILFVLICILTLNYLNKILANWQLCIIVGYKNKLIICFYYFLFLIGYSLVYLLCSFIGFIFTKYISIKIFAFIILALSLAFALSLANFERKNYDN